MQVKHLTISIFLPIPNKAFHTINYFGIVVKNSFDILSNFKRRKEYNKIFKQRNLKKKQEQYNLLSKDFDRNAQSRDKKSIRSVNIDYNN